MTRQWVTPLVRVRAIPLVEEGVAIPLVAGMDVVAAAAGQGAEEDTEQQNPDDSREDENRFAPTEGVHDATSRCWNRASRRLRDPAVRGFLTVMSGDRGAG